MKMVNIPETGVELLEYAFDDDYCGYRFALCNSNQQQMTIFSSCREVLIAELSCLFRHSIYSPEGITKKDLMKTRLLVGIKLTWPVKYIVRKEHHRAMLRALRLVNHFEKIAKWPLTKLFKVCENDIENDEILYLFVADKRWLRAPYIMSMYMLLIRLGRWKQFGKFRSHAGFIKECNEISKKIVPDAALYNDTVKEYDIQFILPNVYMRLKPLMKHFSKIFAKVSTESYYTTACEDLYDGGGIGDLCYNKTKDKKLEKRFTAVCNKNM